MNNFFGLFAKIIGPVLALIYTLVKNYGVSIIILTFLIRLLLIPLYSKQMKYTAKMSEIQPVIKDIQTRYANNKEKMNEEMQKIYQQYGVSPTSGCLPMLIQMPIIFGLFMLLRQPLTYMTAPEMVTAVHEGFFWIPDLCQPDPWILPILAGITTYFTFSVNSGNDATGMTNSMKYFYPVLIFLIGRSFPAGLALYWAVGNLFTIIQNLYFNKQRKNDAIKAAAEAEVIKKRKAEE